MNHLLLALLAILTAATFADEAERDRNFTITIVDHLQRPVTDAVILAPTNTKDELRIFRTNADGVAELPFLEAATCSLEVSAEGFRETLWNGEPNVPQTIVMLPLISGRVLNDKEQPVMDAWLTSEPVVFGTNCRPEFPIRTISDAGQHWSNREGEFRLQSAHAASSLLKKNSESLMPLFVFERTLQFGNFHFLPLSRLDKPLELTLQPLVPVEITYSFNGNKPPRSFRWIITDKEHRTLAEIRAAVETNIYETTAKLNCILPAGEYELHCLDMIPEHKPVVIPVKLSGEIRSLTLKEQDVEPDMIAALAPEIGEVPEAPLLNPDDIESPKGNWGSIYGRIIGDRATVRHRPATVFHANPALKISQDIPSEDLKVNAKTGGVENVFIWMVKRPETIHPDLIKPSPDPILFEQKGARFVPRALIVRTSQSVTVGNADPLTSNVHIYPMKNQPANLRIGPGVMGAQAEKLSFSRAESLPMRVASDFHSWMSAYWLVVDHPYATKTNSEGDFAIQNLPPGEHAFNAWHERKGFIHRKLLIRVEVGKVTKVDFEPVSLVQP